MRRVEAIWCRETLSPLLNNLHLELSHCQQLKEEYRLLLSLTVAFEHLPLNNPDKVNALALVRASPFVITQQPRLSELHPSVLPQMSRSFLPVS